MRWRADPRACIAVPLDAFTAIFHRPSGITHLLAEPAPEILAMLAEPLDEAELRKRLAADYELDEDEDGGALAARLEELAVAGLIALA